MKTQGTNKDSRNEKTIYQRNTAYSFFIGAILILPTIAILYNIISYDLNFVWGIIAVLTVYLFLNFHFGIKYNKTDNLFTSYLGYKFIYKTIMKIKVSEITSYNKNYKKMKNSYKFLIISYKTSSRVCRLNVVINGKENITLVTGTEKGISKIIDIIDHHLSKNEQTINN